MKRNKIWIYLSIISIAIEAYFGIYKNYTAAKYLDQEICVTLNITNKAQVPELHKYEVTKNNSLVFMDSTGVYHDFKVSLGTYLNIKPPCKKNFYFERGDYNRILGLPDTDGGWYKAFMMLSILWTLLINLFLLNRYFGWNLF